MCDASDVLRVTPHDTTEHEVPLADTLRPKTPPLPDISCTLRRTMSYASINTVLPPSRKGVRRRITEIAETLKHKSTKKIKQCEAPKDASDSKALSASKAAQRRQKATTPLGELSPGSDGEGAVAITDRPHSCVPSEQDVPAMFLGWNSDVSLDEPLLKDEKLLPDCSLLPKDTLRPLRAARVDIKDVQLDVQPSEPDTTIWDGLQAAHHLFQCRVFLRCTTHPYDSVSIPDIHRFELDCYTHPPGSRRFVKPPALQTTYNGASPRWAGEKPDVDLTAGIHMDRAWHRILNADGTWGWYRDAFVPLSPRLFDKMEYREFRLVSRLWAGEACIVGESTFAISMLLREVDMK